MSALLAAFGCAGTDTDTDDGAGPPPFSYGSGVWPNNPNGAQNGNSEGSAEGAQATNETGSNAAAPSNTPANEGQNTGNLPIAPAPSGMGAAPATPPAGGMTGTPVGNGQQTGNGMQAGNGQGNGNGMQANPPATPPPPTPRAPLDCNAPAPALTGGTQACTVNASGRADGQSWFLWYGGNGGCVTTYDTAAFKATWNNSGDYLARMGLAFDNTKTFDQYGTISADMSFTKTGTAGNYSFIGVYGWSMNPLIEYYIVENSFQNGPQTPYATTPKGQFTVDGATYRVFQGQKNNQPAITGGNANFQQFFSVRQTPRQCGHISISEHFKAWQGMGMTLGKMYEARILVEAGGGSGSATFTTAYVSTTAN